MNQVNEEKSTQADRARSPRPAQVEDLATPWHYEYHVGLHCVFNAKGVLQVSPSTRECAEGVITAVNEYEGLKARVKKLEAALNLLAVCDLHSGNCSSVELAAHRVRNIARAALIESPDTKEEK